MKKNIHRSGQVAETVRQVLGEALIQEIRDPRVGRVTITAVTVTPDLSRARVRVIAGDGMESDQVMEGLRSAAGFLRTKVAKVLTTRVAPEIVFELDRGQEHAARIDQLLASLREGDEV